MEITDKQLTAIAVLAGCGIVFCLVMAAVQSISNSEFCEGLGMAYERGGKARLCVDSQGRAFSMSALMEKHDE